jgi:hypothetical protein
MLGMFKFVHLYLRHNGIVDQKCQLLPISLGIPLSKYTIKHHKTLGLQPHIESYKTPTSNYWNSVVTDIRDIYPVKARHKLPQKYHK